MNINTAQLEFDNNGQLKGKPECPLCHERKGWVYSEARELFVCGNCYAADQAAIEHYRIEALKHAINKERTV